MDRRDKVTPFRWSSNLPEAVPERWIAGVAPPRTGVHA